MDRTQNYANHRRYFPIYHYVASPLLSLGLGWALAQWIRTPSWGTAMGFAFALGVITSAFAARLMALRVQDRVIRLEMRLRLREVLPAEMHPSIGELRTGQLVALRFAPDAELPDLVRRTLAGEFARANDIKKAIRDWQADWLRA